MSDRVLKMFTDAGARLEGHFLLTSGLHSPVYWEKFQVLQFPEYTVKLCRMIARRFRGEGVEVVAGPTTGGIILAFEVARQLGVRAIYAEKADGGRVFRRGFTVRTGERVLIVDDILTTGGSANEVIVAVGKLSGKVVGVAVLVDRSQALGELGVPLFSCLRAEEVAYPPAGCPLCVRGVPLVRLGGAASK